jgi:UV DNA damage endonuclease
MLRLGLCCIFVEEPIRFRTTTARHLLGMPREAALAKLGELCLDNAAALASAIGYCAGHGIGCFRINSQILPVKTHPQAGYGVDELPNGAAVRAAFQACGRQARETGVRLTFHPDQFILLNSPRPEVVASSLADLAYHAEVAEWVGADVVNIHAGGVYGDKGASLDRLTDAIGRLPETIRSRLTIENDDRCYTPRDLLPVCRTTGVPLVYDVHHHRCLGDGLAVERATEAALATWDREPLFHVSSPRVGWGNGDAKPHHDFIDPTDLPECWRSLDATVEVEAKAKEVALGRLLDELRSRGWQV